MDDPVYAFAAEARRYCTLIESDAASNSWMFAEACLRHVLRLYEQALLLPEIEPSTTDLLAGIDQETWEAVRTRTGQKLARDCYWEIFEPFEQEKPEPVVGSISDDLADIWRDLKRGLMEIDKGRPASISDAVWDWRCSFETHWGHHAAEAIFALNALCFGQFADASRPQPTPDGS